MPFSTTPVPAQSGQVMPNCARIALRMNSLLFGSASRKSARSSSTLKATICFFWVLCGFRVFRGMRFPEGNEFRRTGWKARRTTQLRKSQRNHRSFTGCPEQAGSLALARPELHFGDGVLVGSQLELEFPLGPLVAQDLD